MSDWSTPRFPLTASPMPPLAYLAATASFALALATLAAIARGRRTPAHYAFALGMAVLGVESLLIGQLNATWTEPEYLRLIAWRHALLALIPAPMVGVQHRLLRGATPANTSNAGAGRCSECSCYRSPFSWSDAINWSA